MSVDEYVGNLASPQREISEKLRNIIKDTDNNLIETIKWNTPVYTLNKNICSIVAHKNHVNLQIFQGGNIKDHKKLQGTGKNMRHLRFLSTNDVEKNSIQRYLKQAIVLDRE